VKVEIWSDVVCPWCYIGKRRFEAALAGFEQADEVELVWRSFELDPDAPRAQEGSSLEHLAGKYGMSLEQARAAQDRVSELAQAEGLDYRLAETRRGNSFDAHRLLHLARTRGAQDVLKERLMHAYFSEGSPIAEPDVLERLGVEAGLERAEVAETLAGDRFAEEVRDDERRARALGIRAVPFFVIDERFGIEGAQPSASILDALRHAAAPGAVS
jgi:predicted DsbA family dithiol-disulfide isomerase